MAVDMVALKMSSIELIMVGPVAEDGIGVAVAVAASSYELASSSESVDVAVAVPVAVPVAVEGSHVARASQMLVR